MKGFSGPLPLNRIAFLALKVNQQINISRHPQNAEQRQAEIRSKASGGLSHLKMQFWDMERPREPPFGNPAHSAENQQAKR